MAWHGLRLSVGLKRVLVHARRQIASSPAASAASSSSSSASAAANEFTETIEIAKTLIKFGGIVGCVQNYAIQSIQCVGPSMMPTFGTDGDVVLILPTASNYVFGFTLYPKPRRGDVVICASPTDPGSTVCKRIAGMPGDLVHRERVPGVMAREREVMIPPGQCWLLGDNPSDSTDSRYYGTVPLALIKGVVFVKLWPRIEFIGTRPPRPEEREALLPPDDRKWKQDRWERLPPTAGTPETAGGGEGEQPRAAHDGADAPGPEPPPTTPPQQQEPQQQEAQAPEVSKPAEPSDEQQALAAAAAYQKMYVKEQQQVQEEPAR